MTRRLEAIGFAITLGAGAAWGGCTDPATGLVGNPSGEGAPLPSEVVPEASALLAPTAFGPSALRRQNRAELRASLTEVFRVDPAELVELLPADVVGSEVESPFDNDARLQDVSTDLVVRLDAFARAYGDRVASAPAQALATAGCQPSGPGDAACFGSLVRSAGRLAFRRMVTDDEVARLSAFLAFAQEDDAFGSAVSAFVRAVVQHPEFLYRVESGEPTGTPGAFLLDGREIATRLAFLFWGQVPDAALLDAAEAGKLASGAGRLAEAERMLKDPRAKRHLRRFHAQWLGYANVTPPVALAADLDAETSALVDRVVLDEKRDWMDLFRFGETYVTPALAVHYGMTPPASAAWVPYEGSRGGGVLAHGAFLLQGSKFGDTSPTLRGYRILKRVLCGELGAIPDGIDTDNPPASASPSACKTERYGMRNVSSCATCHTKTDDIGFGLENFGPTGEWRATEPNLPACTIAGQGAVLGQAFSGPRQLGETLASDPDVASCADRQLLRFALGRPDTPEDGPTLAALDAQQSAKKELGSLLRAFAESAAIAHRIERTSP